MDFKLVFVFGLFAYFCVEFVETRPQLPNIPREFQNINFEQYLRVRKQEERDFFS